MAQEYVYALFHEPTKCFIMDTGYYGNAHSIAAFRTKKECDAHIDVYYRGKGYRSKRMRVK